MPLPALPDLDGVEHRWVRAGGLDLHVAEAGEGPPLVMLHGWPQHWWMWRHLIPELSRHYRVICPDLPGLGWSEAPAGGYAKEALASDVLRLLDALGLDRVRLVGHDWGGFVGFLLCLRQPERFERFVALNIVHPWPSPQPMALASLPRLSYQLLLALPGVGPGLLQRRPGFVRWLIAGTSGHPEAWTDHDLALFAETLRQPERARASSMIYRTFLLRELGPLMRGAYRSKRLETPTLLIFGTDDPVIPTSALEGYEPYADDMSVQLVPGAGHFIAEEAPEAVLEHALPFLEGQWVPAGGRSAPEAAAR